jgi:hypothetical protein
MPTGSYYAIGNSNWVDEFGNPIGLAIHKTNAHYPNAENGEPVYKFVRVKILPNGPVECPEYGSDVDVEKFYVPY